MISENLDAFFDDFGVAVTSGSTSDMGLFDAPGVVVGDGRSVSTSYSVLVKASLFGSLKYGDDISVGSVDYTVIENIPEDDGIFTRITLSVSDD